jgi:cation transport ATPase
VAKKTSRKRRKQRRPARGVPDTNRSEPVAATPPERAPGTQRGYARSRAKDDAARARLEPLAPGERPTAVAVGAMAAAVLGLANVIALVIALALGYDTEEGRLVVGTILFTAVLALMAVGMWRARYWAVLGMQTLLALTIIFSSLALVFAISVWAAILALLIIAAAGTLFWFLVKAMARIQMPARPGATRGSRRES